MKNLSSVVSAIAFTSALGLAGEASAVEIQYLGFTGTTTIYEAQTTATQTNAATDVTMTLSTVASGERFRSNDAGTGVWTGSDRPFFVQEGQQFDIVFNSSGVLQRIRSVAGSNTTGDIVTAENLTTNATASAEVPGNNGVVGDLTFNLSFSAGDVLRITTTDAVVNPDWQIRRIDADVTPIPEPGSMGLAAAGLALFGLRRGR